MSRSPEQDEKSLNITAVGNGSPSPRLPVPLQPVQTAVQLLGSALLRSKPKASVKQWFAEATLTPDTYYAGLLRTAYRLMFVLVVERRGLLHPLDTTVSVRQLYQRMHSFERIARLAAHDFDSESVELWKTTKTVLSALARGEGSLGIPALGGIFEQSEHPIFTTGEIRNAEFVDIMRALSGVAGGVSDGNIDWAAVSGEELGSLHEQLLELTPRVDLDAMDFRTDNPGKFATARRSSGSYYTPAGLVDFVTKAALDRCIADALKRRPDAPRDALLALRIVDPACGSGHFVLAAARRLAEHLERYVIPAPGSDPAQCALQLVIEQCVYGVDLDATAVELCKLNLWLTAAEPGKPLSCLDKNIQHGNALIGAPPTALESGIPASAWQVANKQARRTLQQRNHASQASPPPSIAGYTNEQVRTLSDVWCAAFFWPLTSEALDTAPTTQVWSELLHGRGSSHEATLRHSGELAAQHAFFHWHLRFQTVFDNGGFDVVLGNPPWIAHAGRAAQPLSSGVKHFYASNYAAFSRYITTHGLFTSVLPRLLREGGYLGFVLPSSLSELAGYEPTRRAHDALCTFVGELTDFGEGRFEGVTQPCMALVTKRDASGRVDAPVGAPWPVARPDLSIADQALLEYITSLPTLPSDLFAERGLQSDATLRAHFTQSARPVGRFTVPVREGTDVREFVLLPVRVHVDPSGLGKRLRAASEFAQVSVVIRQTARYPIAAISDGLAFRNSLLACLEHTTLSPHALVALLNSTLIRWHHYMRFRDARQPILPQVKISHLRAIPEPPGDLHELNAELSHLGAQLSSTPTPHIRELRLQLDDAVVRAYQLSESQAALLKQWRYA